MILKRKTVIEFAKARMEEAIRQGEDDYIIRYWRAYLDGAESQSSEDAKRLAELNELLSKLQEQVEELAKMLWVDVNA